MSSGASLLKALINGIISVLNQRQDQQGPTRGSGDPRGTRGAKPTATWRGDAKPGSRHRNETVAEASPGQTGGGATRDLSRAELKAMRPSYAPKLDGEPDPGEVIWTWVPYVENDGRGKDRPVLIIARLDAQSWAACYLSTKHHRDFVSVGTGSWDSQGRESYLSPERVLRVTDAGMRRESIGIDRSRYEAAVAAVLRWHGLD